MKLEKLTSLIVKTLEDNKASEITALNVKPLTSIADYFIICSATSTRHAKTLADKLTRATREQDIRPFGIEGETQGEWILIDFTDVVVHIMLPKIRDFYSLEKLWAFTEEIRQKSAN